MSTTVESTRTGPQTEVRRKRRTYTAKYKLSILAKIEAATGRGSVGEIMRRERLYSSLISEWRNQRDAGALEVMSGQRRGPKGKHPALVANERLRAEVSELKEQLQTAQTLIEAQGKVSGLLQQMVRKSPEPK
jgi:transposase